jgi:hypothetical protein
LTGQNQTSSNLAAHTYSVSGNYLQRDTLGKLTYTFSQATRLTLTGYTATSWSDKSGKGDNDFVTPAYQTLVGNNLVSQATAGSPSTVTGANGNTVSCVGSIAALNNAHPNGFCETAAQYAAATAGPQGGGPGPWQALRNQDYHARFNTQVGPTTLTLDGFTDSYGGIYSRTTAGGPSYENVIKTSGLLISDDLSVARNDIGFGYYTQVQKITGSTNQPVLDANGNLVGYSRTANNERRRTGLRSQLSRRFHAAAHSLQYEFERSDFPVGLAGIALRGQSASAASHHPAQRPRRTVCVRVRCTGFD